jgi:hypothetical protein
VRADREYGPGIIFARPREGSAADMEADLRAVNLPFERSTFEYNVAVPAGYELQWAAALRDFSSVKRVDLNYVYYPTAPVSSKATP